MMAADAPLLETDALAVHIGERWICCDLSLRLMAGERLVVLGPNGAGKTTLLHTLAGLRDPKRGVVCLQGRPLQAWSGGALARARAVLPQREPDWFAATVMETALVGRHPHLSRWAWEGAADVRIAGAALDCMGLHELAARSILSLSAANASGWRSPVCLRSNRRSICSTNRCRISICTIRWLCSSICQRLRATAPVSSWCCTTLIWRHALPTMWCCSMGKGVSFRGRSMR